MLALASSFILAANHLFTPRAVPPQQRLAYMTALLSAFFKARHCVGMQMLRHGAQRESLALITKVYRTQAGQNGRPRRSDPGG
jgi:hypothetical protein